MTNPTFSGGEALRDDPTVSGGEALRDDPNNGCGGD